MSHGVSVVNLLILIPLVTIVIASVVVPFIYLLYINRLEAEDCKCSEGFNRSFVKFYSAYVYIAILVVVVVSMLGFRDEVRTFMHSDTRMIMATGFSILVALSLFVYQKKVYETNCRCATKSYEPKLMKIHAYIIAVLVFISCFNIISMLAGNQRLGTSIRNSIKNNIKK